MENLSETLYETSFWLETQFGQVGGAVAVAVVLILVITGVAMGRLYAKAGQPAWACFVPVYNVVVFLRIIGRPANHIWLFLVPVYNIYLIVKVHFELLESFGKRHISDYILMVVLNIFYILNLGLSYETEYVGPAYGTARPETLSNQSAAQVA